MELENDKKRLAQLSAATAQRRQDRDEKFAPKATQDSKKSGNALSAAEKYKSMDEHRIELDELFKRLAVDPKAV